MAGSLTANNFVAVHIETDQIYNPSPGRSPSSEAWYFYLLFGRVSEASISKSLKGPLRTICRHSNSRRWILHARLTTQAHWECGMASMMNLSCAYLYAQLSRLFCSPKRKWTSYAFGSHWQQLTKLVWNFAVLLGKHKRHIAGSCTNDSHVIGDNDSSLFCLPPPSPCHNFQFFGYLKVLVLKTPLSVSIIF